MQAINTENPTINVAKEFGGIMGGDTYNEAESSACSLDGMMNGGTFEACQ